MGAAKAPVRGLFHSKRAMFGVVIRGNESERRKRRKEPM